jgi:hypothetical protein
MLGVVVSGVLMLVGHVGAPWRIAIVAAQRGSDTGLPFDLHRTDGRMVDNLLPCRS